jgi:hypothetical protein
MCPMMMKMDAQIVASDTSDGAAIAFTTTGDVAGLRMRVRHMADMRNRMANGMMGMGKGDGMRGGDDTGMRDGGMRGDLGGGMQRGGMGMMQMVPARASVEDIPGGARLVLTPADPARLVTLRQQTHAQAAMMQRGECPMMQSPPASEPKQQPPKPDEHHEQHHPAGT